MRKRISEINKFPHFDLYSEYRKIEYILSEKKLIGTYDRYGGRLSPSFTLEQYINDLYFTNWNLRGTFLSISEMRESLGIAKDTFTKRATNANKVLDFLQYAANCHYRIATTIKSCMFAYLSDEGYLQVLLENMKELTNKLDAHFSADNDTSELFVTLNDDIALVVAEEHPAVGHKISEYKRIDLQGDLERKGEILCTLFKYLESVEKKFKGATYEKLCSDTTFLFNRIGIRHWIDTNKPASRILSEMGPTELEVCYDRAYTMFLSCMVISQYLDEKKDIDKLKQTL